MKIMNAVKRCAMPVVGGLTLVATQAHAALPTEATAAFTSLSGNVTDIFAAVWPIVAAVVGGFVLIGLFKKGASKVA
jgi:hypothetical protein